MAFFKKRRTKKYLFFVALATFSLSYLITNCVVFYYHDHPPLPNPWHRAVEYFTSDDVSCYNDDEQQNFLVPITEKLFIANRIYFHETSCGPNLGLRQACAIESAARTHPNRQIQVLFVKPLSEYEIHRGPLSEVYSLPNVDLSRIDLNTYALNTPLEEVFTDSLFSYGRRHYRRLAEYLKFLTLYNFGGMVFDTDVIFGAPTDSLERSWLALADEKSLGSAVMSMERDKKGKNLSRWFLEALRDQVTSEEIDGGEALHEVMTFVCNTSDVSQMSKQKCGVEIYTYEFFYPFNRTSWWKYFKRGNADDLSYGYHFWNSKSHMFAIPTDSVFANLASRFCPAVFHRFRSTLVDY